MSRLEAEHVVAVASGVDRAEPRSHSRCLHCGERLVIELPVQVDVWLAANRKFIAAHRKCKPQPSTEVRP